MGRIRGGTTPLREAISGVPTARVLEVCSKPLRTGRIHTADITETDAGHGMPSGMDFAKHPNLFIYDGSADWIDGRNGTAVHAKRIAEEMIRSMDVQMKHVRNALTAIKRLQTKLYPHVSSLMTNWPTDDLDVSCDVQTKDFNTFLKAIEDFEHYDNSVTQDKYKMAEEREAWLMRKGIHPPGYSTVTLSTCADEVGRVLANTKTRVDPRDPDEDHLRHFIKLVVCDSITSYHATNWITACYISRIKKEAAHAFRVLQARRREHIANERARRASEKRLESTVHVLVTRAIGNVRVALFEERQQQLKATLEIQEQKVREKMVKEEMAVCKVQRCYRAKAADRRKHEQLRKQNEERLQREHALRVEAIRKRNQEASALREQALKEREKLAKAWDKEQERLAVQQRRDERKRQKQAVREQAEARVAAEIASNARKAEESFVLMRQKDEKEKTAMTEETHTRWQDALRSVHTTVDRSESSCKQYTSACRDHFLVNRSGHKWRQYMQECALDQKEDEIREDGIALLMNELHLTHRANQIREILDSGNAWMATTHSKNVLVRLSDLSRRYPMGFYTLLRQQYQWIGHKKKESATSTQTGTDPTPLSIKVEDDHNVSNSSNELSDQDAERCSATDSVVSTPASSFMDDGLKQELDLLRQERALMQEELKRIGDDNLQLQRENMRLIKEDDDQKQCVLCMNDLKVYVAVPCGHRLYCEHCYQSRQNAATPLPSTCPVCVSVVSQFVKVYD